MSEQRLNRLMSESLLTRNISVIAHVDHGKSSLCDCLLNKAGQLNAKDLGSCALDSLAEESARGITIVSSAVSLAYEMDHETHQMARDLALERMNARENWNKTNASLHIEDGATSVSLYCGNLPFECGETQLRSKLATAEPDVASLVNDTDLCQIQFRKNGSATITLKGDSFESAAQTLVQCDKIEIEKRFIVIEQVGNGIMSKVQRFARAQKVDVPAFVVTATKAGGFECDGFAGETRRAARHGAAREWMAKVREPLPALTAKSEGLLLNLIDSPGHVDFSAEVTGALRLTDGALVVVDCVEGPASQTTSVLRQALREKVRAVLFLNKIDRAMNMAPTELYDKLQRSIAAVNAQLKGKQAILSFESGTVAIGSALEGWAVTLDALLERFNCRGVDIGAMKRSLTKASTARNAFCKFVLKPLYTVRQNMMEGKVDKVFTTLEKLACAPVGKRLQQWREFVERGDNKQLLRMAMRQMFPLADATLRLVTLQLPSPVEAQQTRAAHLYPFSPADQAEDSNESSDDDDNQQELHENILRGIANCSNSASTVLFTSKMVEINDRMYSLGRVFSGTLRMGKEMYIDDGEGHSKKRKAKVLAVALCTARGLVRVEKALAGSLVAVAGLGLACGTATDVAEAHSLAPMKALVSDVVGVSLALGRGARLDAHKKMVDALRQLTAADASLRVVGGQGGDALVLRACGELQLEVTLSRLRGMVGAPIVASDPVVALRETIVNASPRAYLGKSSNKHNRVYVVAEPIEDARLVKALDEATTDVERRALLRSVAKYSVSEVKRVVAFAGSCMLVDRTSGISIAPVADSLNQAFQQVCANGVLARDQELVGVKLIVTDPLKYHADAKHRAPSHIVPAASRAMTAALLGAGARLVEPLVRLEANAPSSVINDVYKVLHRRGAECEAAGTGDEHGFVQIAGVMSVLSSLGVANDLRSATKAQAFPTISPHGWRIVKGDPRTNEAANLLVRQVRERHGLSADIPEPSDDRL